MPSVFRITVRCLWASSQSPKNVPHYSRPVSLAHLTSANAWIRPEYRKSSLYLTNPVTGGVSRALVYLTLVGTSRRPTSSKSPSSRPCHCFHLEHKAEREPSPLRTILPVSSHHIPTFRANALAFNADMTPHPLLYIRQSFSLPHVRHQTASIAMPWRLI